MENFFNAENPAVSFWNERYQARQFPWDLGQAAPPLISWTAQYSEGLQSFQKIGVVGSGLGHDAVYFASLPIPSLKVTGMDFAPEAVRLATERYGKQFPEKLYFIQQDLFQPLTSLQGSFDLIVEHTLFCAISPSLRADYVKAVSCLLKPNGYFLGLFWTHKHSGGPPFGSTQEEIKALFSTRFKILQCVVPENSVVSRQGEETLILMRLN